MGGRGSSSGVLVKGVRYGTNFSSVLAYSNIKFVVDVLDDSIAAPMETMTNGRVYVTLSKELEPKHITYFGKDNKRSKQVDLNNPHHGMDPHTHQGHFHNENDPKKDGATESSKKEMINRVRKVWDERGAQALKIWKKRDISQHIRSISPEEINQIIRKMEKIFMDIFFLNRSLGKFYMLIRIL